MGSLIYGFILLICGVVVNLIFNYFDFYHNDRGCPDNSSPVIE